MMINNRQKPSFTTGFENLRLDFPTPVFLDNGIPLTVVGDGDDEICRLSILMRGGQLVEQKAFEVASFAMGLIAGSANRSAEEISEIFDYNGSWVGSQVYDNFIETTVSLHIDRLNEVLPEVLECLDRPSFKPSDMAPIFRVLRSQCAMARKRVKYLASVELKRLYYGDDHPLSRNPKPEDIDLITTDLLHQYHDKYYNVENCILVAAGHITKEEIAIINNTFGKWNRHGNVAEEPKWWRSPANTKVSVIEKPDAVQTAIAIAMPGVKRTHEDYLKLRVLTTVLGGYFGSRLMSNIREDKGYTYGIGASLLGRKHESMVGISSECDARYTKPVLIEIEKEVKRLKEELIGDDELAIVKQYMMSDLAKTLDTPFSIASAIKGQWLFGTYPEYFNNQVETIENITAAELREIARKYYREDEMFKVLACDKSLSGIG